MSKAISTKITVALVILFLLAGIAYGADAKDQGKDVSVDTSKDTSKDTVKNETIVDKTKETSKNIDTGIKVKDATASLASYKVTKEKDKITVSKPDESEGHTKTILTLDKATAQSIDIDKDNKFSVSRWVDGRFVSSKIVTLAELTSGTEVVFSETIVNGLTGTRTTTFLNVTSGQTLNIQDAAPDAVTVSVGGSVPGYVSGIPTNGLVAHYPLVLNANDISGHGINGTSSNVVYSANGAYFNGNNSKITIPSNALLNVGNNFTYIWIQNRPVSAAKVRTIYNRAAQSNTVAYDWIHGTSGSVNTTFQYSNGTARYSPTGPLFTPNKLLHIASSMNPAYQHKTYINGTLISTAYRYGRISPTTGSLYIGSYQGGTLYTFNGTLRDFTIYNRTLSAGEILQHYADGSGISFQPEPSSNFTGYNVGSGIAKTLDIDSTVTGIEVVNTAGTTLSSVTVKEYYTNDTTVITDSHTSTMQTVNITHSTPATMGSGTLLPYPILDGYDGTATLTSDNANATISQNGTTFTIDTGYLPAGQTFNYLVTIPASFRTSGSYTVTSYNVTSGTTIDVPDGAYTGAEVRVGGSVPSYYNIFDNITRNESILSKTASYHIIPKDGTANWGRHVNGDTREFIQDGNNNRFRQTGNITHIELNVTSYNKMDEFYYTVWRKNGTNYDRIYKSDNLQSEMHANDYHLIQLSAPVAVQEGDYYGYIVHSNSTNFQLYVNTADTSGHSTYLDSEVPTINGYNWSSYSGQTAFTYTIHPYITHPVFVSIGNSITAGHPLHYSYIETTSSADARTKSYEYKLSQLLNFTNNSYQNMGIGSQTTTQIRTRFVADVVNLQPDIVIIGGGVNDVAGSVANATIIDNIEYMLSTANNASVHPVLVGIMPWTNGNEAQHLKIDYLNTQYESLASEYNATYVDTSSYVGVDRDGYYSGNLWDINPSYDAGDHVHFNEAGNAQIAQAIINEICRGIMFVPLPSENITAYDVSSGIAKTLDIDSTVTGIEVVNTAGTTLQSVTATLQMDTSSDIINVIESTSGQQHWANITLNPGKDYTDYIFTYPRPTGWTGSATMLSNNTAATVTSNNTHFMIDMGPLTTNETKYYNVGITSSITSFIDVPAVTVVIITAAGAFIGASFIGAWYRKRKAS